LRLGGLKLRSITLTPPISVIEKRDRLLYEYSRIWWARTYRLMAEGCSRWSSLWAPVEQELLSRGYKNQVAYINEVVK